MPTRNRRSFVQKSLNLFLRQECPRIELIILDDGAETVADLIPAHASIRYQKTHAMSLGSKRNSLCEMAQGEVIVHWDDDDWYSSDRVRRCSEMLLTADYEICGTSSAYVHDTLRGRAWLYRNQSPGNRIVGSTLAYRKAFWKSHPFPDRSFGEEFSLTEATPPERCLDLLDPTLCVISIHRTNTVPKFPSSRDWRVIPTADLPKEYSITAMA